MPFLPVLGPDHTNSIWGFLWDKLETAVEADASAREIELGDTAVVPPALSHDETRQERRSLICGFAPETWRSSPGVELGSTTPSSIDRKMALTAVASQEAMSARDCRKAS